MKTYKSILILFLALSFFFTFVQNIYSGHREISETDNGTILLFSVFDLRERESYVQVTNTGSSDITIHIQIHNVDLDCNENNFYDTLTPNDTHVYNLRDIQTNNGAPSGVVLPNKAYGRVTISAVQGVGLPFLPNNPINRVLIGNFRILDDLGYEYRTNSAGSSTIDSGGDCIEGGNLDDVWTFNFNKKEGVTFSDIFLLTQDNDPEDQPNDTEIRVDPVEDYELFDVDIYDLNETAFSCRNVIFSCTDQENSRYEEILEFASGSGGSASVASFEYGINEAIPHSKGGELLCPGNTIEEGFVQIEELRNNTEGTYGFIGLNDGNGRGSMDAMFSDNCTTSENSE